MIDTTAIRKRILELAYQGNLSEQSINDGDVDVLYNNIRKFVANKELPEVEFDERFIEIPGNWKWVRVGNIAKINPKNDCNDNEEASFIPMALVTEGFHNKHTFEIKEWGTIKKGFNHLLEGDIGVAKITPCFQNRKSVVFQNLHNGFGACTTELIVIRTDNDCLLNEYLLYFFKTEEFIHKGVDSFTGVVGQQRIHKDYLKMSPIPLPPVEEQRRIVKKIKESFELIDVIDRLQQHYSSDIEILKSKIFDAGIQGKLTEQLSEDGTAEELLAQIAKEKKQLIKEKKIKATKALPEITEDEMPFEIPGNWKWVHLEDTGVLQTGATPPKTDPEYFGNDIPFLSPGEIKDNSIVTYDKQGLSKLGIEKARVVDENSVLQVCIGGSIGKAAINDRKVTFNQQINSVTPIFCDSKFLFYCMIGSHFIGKIQMASAGAATPIINKSKWGELLIPLPPVAEQKRIVDRIDEICLCVKGRAYK